MNGFIYADATKMKIHPTHCILDEAHLPRLHYT